jgi:hypothetical protein
LLKICGAISRTYRWQGETELFSRQVSYHFRTKI